MTDVGATWASGSRYEDFMGRWSRQLAPLFVSWLGIRGAAHWLDVGCGTGAMTSAICQHAHPASVTACDPAAPFIEYARHHSNDACASFVVAGVGNLPRHAGGYGSITSLLALNFFPNADAAIREMQAHATAGGTVSACVWDYRGKMELLRYFWDAAAAMDSTLDEGSRFPICRPDALTELFHSGGLRDVQCEPLDMPTTFANFDDYWGAFLGGTGPAPAYVGGLDPDRRDALARRIEQALPREADGTIPLTARAWAVRGTAD
jgi:SAM-dependent methyltransferase